MKRLLISFLIVATTAIFVMAQQSGVAAQQSTVAINEVTARNKAVSHYNALFGDKFYLNPVDQKHHLFPKLTETFFHKAEFKDGNWSLEGDPPAGVHVYASVSADGKWVQLTRVGFAPE